MLNIDYNPFSQSFLKARNSIDVEREVQIIKNSQGKSSEELMLADASQNINHNYGVGYSPGADFSNSPAAFKAVFSSKVNKIATYREMSNFPEIIDALNIISDEAITKDDSGKYVKLKINRDLPTREQKHILKTFDYIVEQVLKFDDYGWKYFRTWLIDSELFLEKIMNDDKNKLIGVKILPSQSTYPVYEGSVIKKFIQNARKDRNTSKDISFEANQVCYLHWDDYGTSLLDVRGYLEPAIRTWNQYRNLQDALIIYRLVRAPERRLWNVEAGRLPPGKSEEYLKQLIARYRKNYTWNSETGTVDSTKLFQALTEDYWFIKREGQGTTVDTLQSSMNLGDLEDVNLFLRSLYKSLQIPKSRWEDTLNSVTSNTAPGEITREEVRFSKMVNRFRNRFKKIFLDLLCTQLTLSNQIDKKYTREHIFDIEFCDENVFAEQKKLLNQKSQLEVMALARDFVASKDNPNGVYSKRYFSIEFAGLTAEEYQNMRNEIKAELEEDSDTTGDNTGETPPENPPEEETTPVSQTMNTANQEMNAEEEPETKTPEGSKEQLPPEEPGAIQLP